MAAPTETFLPRRQEGDAGGGCPGRGFSLPFEERLGPRGWGVEGEEVPLLPPPTGGAQRWGRTGMDVSGSRLWHPSQALALLFVLQRFLFLLILPLCAHFPPVMILKTKQ